MSQVPSPEKLIVSRQALDRFGAERLGPRQLTTQRIWSELTARLVTCITTLNIPSAELRDVTDLPLPLFLRDIEADIYLHPLWPGRSKKRSTDTIGEIVSRSGTLSASNWLKAHLIESEHKRQTASQRDYSIHSHVPAVTYTPNAIALSEIVENSGVFLGISNLISANSLDLIEALAETLTKE